MSVNQSGTTAAIAPLGQSLVRGKITGRRRVKFQSGPRILTLLTMPAVDEYSSPSTIEVTSAQALGQVGDTWAGKVEISGRRRQYKATDPETGEMVTVATADVRLSVVE